MRPSNGDGIITYDAGYTTSAILVYAQLGERVILIWTPRSPNGHTGQADANGQRWHFHSSGAARKSPRRMPFAASIASLANRSR